jgi:hypothetical protein
MPHMPHKPRKLRKKHLIPAIALSAGLLGVSTYDSFNRTPSTDSRKATAEIGIKVVVPAVLRITRDTHPLSLAAADAQTSSVSALQQMVLVSTLRQGFCMNLQLTQGKIASWQIQVSGSAGTWIEPSEGGYRLCANHSGRYDLALQHTFTLKDGLRENQTAAVDWPVSVSLAAP